MSELKMSSATAVVSGSASGIGRAGARALAEVGQPVSLWDLNAEGAAEAAASMGTDCGAVAHAVDAIRDALGSIGGLVHAAGIVTAMDIDHLTEEIWDSVLGANLRAEVFVVQALLDDLRSCEGSGIGYLPGRRSISRPWIGTISWPLVRRCRPIRLRSARRGFVPTTPSTSSTPPSPPGSPKGLR